MKKFLTALLSIFTLSSYSQELWPSKPVEGDSKMGCNTCSILFNEPKGTYSFFQYQAPRPKTGETFILSPKPSLRITFPVTKDQRYSIIINMDAKIFDREFIVEGPGKFKYNFRSKKTSDEAVEVMYKAEETGNHTLIFTTRIDKEWFVKNCKISSLTVK
jgi:hypothetical protein